ncbi:MAG: hypothetical protein ACYCZ1_08405 [Candidatus Humimicrobiaceae bacterium]
MLKRFLITAAISLLLFPVAVIIHNLIYGATKIEESVFFFIAVFICPFGFFTGIIGSIVVWVKQHKKR